MGTYAGNDTYSSTGTLPDDLGAATGANINPYLEFLADRTKWLLNRIRVVAQGSLVAADEPEASAVVVIHGHNVSTNGAFNGNVLYWTLATIPNLQIGDIVEFELSGQWKNLGNTDGAEFKVIHDDGGAAAGVGGAHVYINPAIVNQNQGFAFMGVHTMATAQTLHLALDADTGTSATTIELIGPFTFKWRVYRGTHD
jgi:hypothetical protein